MPLERQGTNAHLKALSSRRSELRQVVLLSRHGVRSPIETEVELLAPFVTHAWPEWDVPPAHLTEHAKASVHNLGEWYGEHYHRLLGCADRPPDEWMYVSADSLERCVTTAWHWLRGFLGTEDPQIEIVHERIARDHQRTHYDPLYLPIESGMIKVHRVDHAVLGQISGDLEGAIESMRGPLTLVEKALGGAVFSPEIHGLENAVLDDGTITGTLQLAVSTSDILVLQHANGWPMEKVAWGRLSRTELLEIERARIFTDNLINRAPSYARGDASNMAAHILAGMLQTVTDEDVPALPFDPRTRFVCYFGHDTNIQTMGGLLDLSWLPRSFVQDQAPPACGMVFELHRDLDTMEHFVRLWFVTSTIDQMASCARLSADNPPSVGPIGLPHTRELTTSLDVPLDDFEHIVREAIALEAIQPELARWFRNQRG